MVRLFGDKLRYVRQQHSLTQTELAYRLALSSHTHISHLEAGRKSPSLELAARIAHTFDVATDYFLHDTIAVEGYSQCATTYAPEVPPVPRLLNVKLRHLRKQHAMTQEDLAQTLASLTQAHISLLELGGTVPSVDLVIRLSELFDVSTDYLLRDDIPLL